jgi:hypothetical protein
MKANASAENYLDSFPNQNPSPQLKDRPFFLTSQSDGPPNRFSVR